MPNYLADAEIARLIHLPKELPTNWLRKLHQLKADPNFRHSRSNIIVSTQDGRFRISLRQNRDEKDDFSVVLMFLAKSKEQRWFRLKRYNGLHPPLGIHKNRIEKTNIKGFHIHTATWRYQNRTPKEEGFAEATSAYVDLWTALDLMITQCGFIKPKVSTEQRGQLRLFNSHGNQR
jgi:hypothetical protein